MYNKTRYRNAEAISAEEKIIAILDTQQQGTSIYLSLHLPPLSHTNKQISARFDYGKLKLPKDKDIIV